MADKLITALLFATSSGVAYSVGDNVGGKIAFSLPQNNVYLLNSLALVDADNQKPGLRLYFFDADPSAGTYVDNGAITLNAADLAGFIGSVAVVAADWTTQGGIATANVAALGKIVGGAAGATAATIYALIVIENGTPTYTAVSGKLIIRPGFVPVIGN